jgi:hypothetical protein
MGQNSDDPEYQPSHGVEHDGGEAGFTTHAY